MGVRAPRRGVVRFSFPLSIARRFVRFRK